MAQISACIISYNEEENIEDCLKSLQAGVDEIIVVDSGSQDKTVSIAKRFTDNVFTEDNWQGFGVQRQRAQQYATSDWILMIDADERVTPELMREIKEIVSKNDQSRVYGVPRLSWVFGRFIRHSGWYPDYVIRLYPREKGRYGQERVHEKLHCDEDIKVKYLQGNLIHYTYRDLEHYLTKSALYAAEWARQRQAMGKRSTLLQGVIHGMACFLKMYILRAGFLDGKQGLLLALLSAHSTFVKYADLWVRTQTHRPRK